MALRIRGSILASILLVGFLVSGCAGPEPRAGTLSVGDAFSSGATDDGRRFYSTTVRVTAGDVELTGSQWSQGSSTSPAPSVNLRSDEEAPAEDPQAYALPDSTDSLPWKVSAPDGGARSVAVTLVFPEASETPTGTLVLTYTSGDEERDLEITPSWSGNQG